MNHSILGRGKTPRPDRMGEVAPAKAGLGEAARARLPAGEGGGAPAGDGWLGGLGEVAPAQPRLGEVARARCAPEAEDTMVYSQSTLK